MCTEPDWRTQTLKIAANHPALEGHFPNEPIIPAVVLLDRLSAYVNESTGTGPLTGFQEVKFLAIVRPDEDLVIRWRRIDSDRIRFEALTQSSLCVLSGIGLSKDTQR